MGSTEFEDFSGLSPLVTWDKVVEANKEQRNLNIINPLLNSRHIVGKKFPIPAQFIFELLQNADDAQAENVILTFKNDEFTCEHDGKKVFKESDAIGISRIGFSGKDESENSIGRFGLGFKSVFQYTDSVRIHSGEFNFSLFDYLWINNGIPKPENSTYKEKSTIFIFEVSDAVINRAKAREEIILGLQELNHRSLIFLQHINSLEIRIDDTFKRIEKHSRSKDIFEVIIKDEVSLKKSFWLRKLEPITLPAYFNTPQIIKKGTFGIAIQIDADEFKLGRTVPIMLDKGVVFSYFPLSLENSGLKFFIHAPFFVEDNRIQFSLNPDSKPGNDELLIELGKFTSKVFMDLVKLDADADALISILPLESEVPEKYKPIVSTLLEELGKARIVPNEKSELFFARQFVHLSKELKGIFHEGDLPLLSRCIDTFDNNSIREASEVPISFEPKNLSDRSLRVLEQIGMIEVTSRIGRRIVELFASNYDEGIFDSREARPSREMIESWLKERNSEQLSNLYLFISNNFVSNDVIKNFPIFKVGSKEDKNFLTNEDTFMSDSPTIIASDTLHPEIFNLYEQNANEIMRKLGPALKKFGISPKDKWEVLKRDYRDTRRRIFDSDMEKEEVARLLALYHEDKLRLLQIVKPNLTLFCLDRELKPELKKASLSIMQNRNNSDLLLRLFSESPDENSFLPIWDGYYISNEVELLFKDLGVKSELFVYESDHGKFGISFLSRILTTKDLFLVSELWNFILTLDKREYFNTAILWKTGGVIEETNLLKTLKANEWIPCKDGSFRKPYYCDVESINPNLKYIDCLAIEKLDFSGFQRDTLRNSEIEQSKAQALGFDSIEQIEEIKKYIEIVGLDHLKQTLANHERSKLGASSASKEKPSNLLEELHDDSIPEVGRRKLAEKADFQLATPRYPEEVRPEPRSQDMSVKSDKRNLEVSRTSEIYVESTVTEEGKERSARLRDIEKRSRIIIEEANLSLGRKLVPMHEQNEGYDFEFYEDGHKKFIEAKGTVNIWDAAGIRLSPRELEYAAQFGPNYEIWIVEQLETESPKVWRISDFPSKIGGFRLNESWIPQAKLFGYDFGETKVD
jgi:hypothetical protein